MDVGALRLQFGQDAADLDRDPTQPDRRVLHHLDKAGNDILAVHLGAAVIAQADRYAPGRAHPCHGGGQRRGEIVEYVARP